MQNFQTDDFIEAVYHFSHVRVFLGAGEKGNSSILRAEWLDGVKIMVKQNIWLLCLEKIETKNKKKRNSSQNHFY